MIRILQNEIEWTTVLREIGNFDFYHTYEYHQLRAKKGETPILVVYNDEQSNIALPFIKRQIFDTDFFDLTSVHGYLGPASKINATNFCQSLFQNQFKKLLYNQNVVSVFSKLNPFIVNQELVLEKIGSIEQVGELLYLDLCTDPILQRQAYRKSVKNDVNKLRRKCSVKRAETEEGVEIFLGIYLETMKRVSADKRFILNSNFFQKLINSEDFESIILLVTDSESGEVIAGSFSVCTNGIIQGEFMGTKTAYLSNSPAKLLYDEIRLIGNQKQMKFLNYGGGAGGREGPLYKMKSGFTKNHIPFKVWKYIVNQDVYDKLSANRKNKENINYFPLYRS
nr:GNAT family N-acetyltransferase [uncultured Allomuricauda sp.]